MRFGKLHLSLFNNHLHLYGYWSVNAQISHNMVQSEFFTCHKKTGKKYIKNNKLRLLQWKINIYLVPQIINFFFLLTHPCNNFFIHGTPEWLYFTAPYINVKCVNLKENLRECLFPLGQIENKYTWHSNHQNSATLVRFTN